MSQPSRKVEAPFTTLADVDHQAPHDFAAPPELAARDREHEIENEKGLTAIALAKDNDQRSNLNDALDHELAIEHRLNVARPKILERFARGQCDRW